jgi:transposase
MDPDTTQEILRLRKNAMGKRAIARKLGLDVKAVRRVLVDHGDPAPPTGPPVPAEPPQRKLEPFYDAIAQKVEQKLSGTRILREIRAMGYTGGRTILLDHLRAIRGASKASERQYRRFETEVASEAQVDWSPYRIPIGGRLVLAHCFAMILCFSRYLFIQFHRDERLATLLAAHVDAFAFFRGVCRNLIYDNMATITLGRRGREPLWNPPFLLFAQHYSFAPRLCRVADPNRKGKVESVFRYVEEDFLRGRSFASWEELDREAASWLTDVANRRRHSTTAQVPEEAWLMERDFLTALPETPYPVCRQEIRPVYDDGLLSLDGSRYSVPLSSLGNARTVTVRVYPRHLDILNREGVVIATHRRPDVPGGVVINEEHYAGLRRKPGTKPGELERRFLALYPGRQDFLDGLKRRMKSLAGLHLAELVRLGQVYGTDAIAEALERVSAYGNWSVYAAARVLRERYPLLSPDVPAEETLAETPRHPPLEDVETGSIEEYGRLSTAESNCPPEEL